MTISGWRHSATIMAFFGITTSSIPPATQIYNILYFIHPQPHKYTLYFYTVFYSYQPPHTSVYFISLYFIHLSRITQVYCISLYFIYLSQTTEELTAVDNLMLQCISLS